MRTSKHGESNTYVLENPTLCAKNPIKEDPYKYGDGDIPPHNQGKNGRLLERFQDGAKYEHVGQVTRSHDGKELKEKDLKISELKTKLKDNDEGSRSKIT
ncbi:hypothetical protein Tco_0512125 [Tanacetum coccineum]